MKQHDEIIKEALQSKMERLDSGDFTNKIVRQHLVKKAEEKPKKEVPPGPRKPGDQPITSGEDGPHFNLAGLGGSSEPSRP